jgi:hypothetical protein
MRITWEEKDIRAGLRYGKSSIRERWIIGYIASSTQEKRWVSVSLMDGMVTPAHSQHELAISLTESGYVPEALLPPIAYAR